MPTIQKGGPITYIPENRRAGEQEKIIKSSRRGERQVQSQAQEKRRAPSGTTRYSLSASRDWPPTRSWKRKNTSRPSIRERGEEVDDESEVAAPHFSFNDDKEEKRGKDGRGTSLSAPGGEERAPVAVVI